MVGTDVDSLLLGFGIVVDEIAVADGGALGTLDIDERYGEGAPLGRMTLAKRRDAQLAPVDGKALATLLVLVARDVYAVDALGGVLDALAQKASFFPLADM